MVVSMVWQSKQLGRGVPYYNGTAKWGRQRGSGGESWLVALWRTSSNFKNNTPMNIGQLRVSVIQTHSCSASHNETGEPALSKSDVSTHEREYSTIVVTFQRLLY
eukprot:scaffold4833_cov233-Amphora_coffeaeformis.AAC.19